VSFRASERPLLMWSRSSTNLLSSAGPGHVNAFTTGFRVAQTKLAIARVVPEAVASVALESAAESWALAILVREQLIRDFRRL